MEWNKDDKSALNGKMRGKKEKKRKYYNFLTLTDRVNYKGFRKFELK